MTNPVGSDSGYLLEAVGLSRRYKPSVLALKEASFGIRAGESVAIIGPSGSGKSTLLALLGLLDHPSTGSYFLRGVDTTTLGEREWTTLRKYLIGFVFQSFQLTPHLTAQENVAHALEIKGRSGRVAQNIAREHLERVGLEKLSGAFPATLSGGEQQRVAIARALASEPALMLCDEPTGNLDSGNSEAVLDLLMQTVSPSRALVVVTHDSTVAARCLRILEVRDGILRERQEA